MSENSKPEMWTDAENQLIVADYFAMLADELAGRAINKTEHRRTLKPLLRGRSDGSIEFKHCNISAVLIELGLGHLAGYKPRGNFQRSLLDEVVATLQLTGLMARLAEPIVESQSPTPALVLSGGFVGFERAPEFLVREPRRGGRAGIVRAGVADYAERDARNRELGRRGEEFVFNLEQQRLTQGGRADLAKRVQWTARDRGDGYGYDLSSFETDGELGPLSWTV